MKLLVFSLVSVIGLATSFELAGPVAKDWRTSEFENVLGTSLELKFRAASDQAASRAEKAALAEIQRLDAVLSGYQSSSEFRRWTATQGAAVPVSADLLDVLKLWDAWRERTSGALNPAAESIARIWTAAQRAGKLPLPSDLA